MSTLAQRVNDLAEAIRNKFNSISTSLLPPGGATGQIPTKTETGVEWANPTSTGGVEFTQSMLPARLRGHTEATDFLSSSATLIGNYQIGSFSSGSVAQDSSVARLANHPGCRIIKSASGTQSGARIYLGIYSFPLDGDEQFSFICHPLSSTADVWLGHTSANSPVRNMNEVMFLISGLVVSSVCKSAGAETTNVMYTLTVGNWYKFKITVASAGNSVLFEVFSDSNTLLATNVITTNLPIKTGVTMNFGISGIQSGIAEDIVSIDYIAATFSNPSRLNF